MAAWINHLNQVRLDELFEAWRQQDINLERAQDSLDEARKLIFEQIIARDRGGLKGMHGFIAEVAEVGVRNARNLVDGMPADTEWINNNGPADLIRNGIQIQQKFVQSGGKLSLNAVEEHLRKYPDFLKNGGKYQIPKDYFEKIQRYLAMTQEEAKQLISSDNANGLSYKQWAWVQNFFKSGEISINDLEPSQNSYVSVQPGNIDNTLNDVQNEIEETHHNQQEAAYEQSKPSFAEGTKATAIAAVIEGGTTFVTEVVKKRKEKDFRSFSEDDWIEILGKTGIGTLRGGVRGSSIYVMSNYTATPAAVASGLVTAAFGVAEQAHRLRTKEITETEFLENAQIVCLDASVSAVSSLLGQALIPIPVLGAIIGNTVGTMLYQIGKNDLAEREQKLLASYAENQKKLDAELAAHYQQQIDMLNQELEVYMVLLNQAFAADIKKSFYGSIKLACYVGVANEEILKSKEEIDHYFMD